MQHNVKNNIELMLTLSLLLLDGKLTVVTMKNCLRNCLLSHAHFLSIMRLHAQTNTTKSASPTYCRFTRPKVSTRLNRLLCVTKPSRTQSGASTFGICGVSKETLQTTFHQ